MKKSIIFIQVVMFLAVILVLYIYYPFAYRTFINIINADWWNSTGQATAGNYISERNNFNNDFLSNILILLAFATAFFAIPGAFLLNMWKISKKLEADDTSPKSNRRKGRRRGRHAGAGLDKKSLLKTYNQFKDIELGIANKFQTLKEELLTEINSEINRLFEMKTEAENCVDKARTLLKAENYDDALQACNNAVKLSPFGSAYYVRGAVHHKLGLNEQAINDLKTAATLGYQKAQDVLSSKGLVY